MLFLPGILFEVVAALVGVTITFVMEAVGVFVPNGFVPPGFEAGDHINPTLDTHLSEYKLRHI